MFTPKLPETLDLEQLIQEDHDTQEYIQELAWLTGQLDDLLIQIHVLQPFYAGKDMVTTYGTELEVCEGATFRVLHQVQRRALTTRDHLAQVRFFLQGKMAEVDTSPDQHDIDFDGAADRAAGLSEKNEHDQMFGEGEAELS